MLNMGPQHPSTHGVLRLLVIVYAEIILWLSVEFGLLHRGSEKLIEMHYYSGSLPYFDRMDYVSTITQECLFIGAIEKLLGVIVDVYLSWTRVVCIEFNRVLNHLLAITTHAIDIGVFSSML